jgi:hypothetical protein
LGFDRPYLSHANIQTSLAPDLPKHFIRVECHCCHPPADVFFVGVELRQAFCITLKFGDFFDIESNSPINIIPVQNPPKRQKENMLTRMREGRLRLHFGKPELPQPYLIDSIGYYHLIGF